MVFKSGFFYNYFLFQLSIYAKNRIMDTSNKKNQQILIFIIIQLLIVLSDLDLIDMALASMITI